MKKYFLLLTALLLTGCATPSFKPTELQTPASLKHSEKTYVLARSSDLGAMARYIYIDRKATLENWKSALEILHDRNVEKRSLEDRIKLRQQVFQQNNNLFDIYLKDQFLYGFVIYEPTEQNKEWQVDVYKGTDVANCGFVQYQFSLKLEKNNKLIKMTQQKLRHYLKKYVAEKELKRLQKANWNWSCKINHAK